MIDEIIDNYHAFIKQQRWGLQTAADKIHVSRGHLCHVFARTRVPSMALLKRMEDVMKYGESHK